MEDKKKKLNNQPQEEEDDEKKKRGIIGWWFGLHRAAQVGICVGAAAIIATAITLPIVLTRNKGENPGETFILEKVDNAYVKHNFKIKKNVTYVFKINIIEDANCAGFEISDDDSYVNIGINSYKVEGSKAEWFYDESAKQLYPKDHLVEVKQNDTLTFTINVSSDCNNTGAKLECGGQ